MVQMYSHKNPLKRNKLQQRKQRLRANPHTHLLHSVERKQHAAFTLPLKAHQSIQDASSLRTHGIFTHLYSKFTTTFKTSWDDRSLKEKGRKNVPKYELKADLSGQCGCESEARRLQRCFYVSSNRSQIHSARAVRR